MMHVPRVENYRGFVFASLAADGPDLATYLGEARSSIDDMVDRAPAGELEVVWRLLPCSLPCQLEDLPREPQRHHASDGRP